MRIMIVEDDANTAKFMEEALARVGHETTSFGHGGLALGALARGKYELLICDLMLPNFNGVETIEMIRKQYPHLPVIVVSGLDPADWEVLCRRAGATCYLHKPLRVDRLLREVELVQSSQVQLDVGVLDADQQHAERLDRELSSMGCNVWVWSSLPDMLADRDARAMTVILVDATLAEATDAIAWCNGHDVAAVAFAADTPEFDQDTLMREGASFCLLKPVNAEALVTQARFFVGSW